MKTHCEVKRINGKRVPSTEYRAWQTMKNRCLNPNASDYKYYGARNISICERWKDSFTSFLEDLGRKPSPEHTLDRIDGDGNYEPSNCQWANRKEQARNRNYAKTKAWLLAEKLGIKIMSAQHLIWQVRQKDKGNTKWFSMSEPTEVEVRKHLLEVG